MDSFWNRGSLEVITAIVLMNDNEGEKCDNSVYHRDCDVYLRFKGSVRNVMTPLHLYH